MKYELTKDLETGNAVIDKEHRELFDAVNRLTEALAVGVDISTIKPTINFFSDYVNRHFAHEEQLQKNSQYPSYAAHKAFHDKYKTDLNVIFAKFVTSKVSAADLVKLNSQVGLLVSHIRTEDKKLGQFLQSKR